MEEVSPPLLVVDSDKGSALRFLSIVEVELPLLMDFDESCPSDSNVSVWVTRARVFSFENEVACIEEAVYCSSTVSRIFMFSKLRLQ